MSSSAHVTVKADQPVIYQVGLQVADEIVTSYFDVLSTDEKRRANKFRFERDRNGYVVTRGSLRVMLALYTGQAPDQIEFGYSRYQKPELKAGSDLKFNVSHSGDYALIAFSHGTAIGVDIEQNASEQDLQLIANHVFSNQELSELIALSEKEFPEGFYNAWTRKEAFIKAVGHGLSFPLKEFTVSLSPGKPAELLETAFDKDEKPFWTMKSLEVHPNYHAAFAIRRPIGDYIFRLWKHQPTKKHL